MSKQNPRHEDYWMRVPREPTSMMLGHGHRNGGQNVSCGRIYRAMIEAAPFPDDSPAVWMKPSDFYCLGFEDGHTTPSVRRSMDEDHTMPLFHDPRDGSVQCQWRCDDLGEQTDIWETACGEMWAFIDGGPADNNVRFCHGCGRPVRMPE